MRASEFLTEDRAGQIDIETLASRISEYLQQGGKTSTVGRITGTSGPLANIKVKTLTKMPTAQYMAKATDAAYDPDTRTILVPRTEKNLVSDLVHELRHALDDIKSGGKFLQGKTNVPLSTKSTASTYLSLPLEINARFSQAIHSIVKDLSGTDPSREEIVQAIKVEFIARDITKFFPGKLNDPMFRRLFTRALTYLEGRL